MSRASIRAELLAQRKALGPARIAVLSRQIGERFVKGCGVPSWKGRHVAFYRSFAGELDPTCLEVELRNQGAELYFPRVSDTRARLMEMAQGGESEWRKGPYGNDEPALSSPAVDPSVLDVVFVPGVAFGLQGERLGMGSGFYDRYLPGAPQSLRIALAFDFQVLPKLDQGSWDQRVDWIWTERRQILLRPFSPEKHPG